MLSVVMHVTRDDGYDGAELVVYSHRQTIVHGYFCVMMQNFTLWIVSSRVTDSADRGVHLQTCFNAEEHLP